jgi:hypothetical protein
MATILEFHRPDDAAAHFDQPLDGLLGEIIIFPGVKIERPGLSDEPQHTGSTKRRRLARDRKKSRG